MSDDRIFQAISRIEKHEAMCEERSKTIFNRLDRIDATLDNMSKQGFTMALMLMGGMAGLIVTLLLK